MDTSDIKMDDVHALVSAFLGEKTSLEDVLEVRVIPGLIEVVHYARDDAGKLYLGEDGLLATHSIKRKVV